MKDLKDIISEKLIDEKLIINKNLNIKEKEFTDEELRNDYNEVSGAYTKAEKEPFKDKYGVNSNKFRDIQLVILDHLRENRQKKKEFTSNDFRDFMRLEPSERYEKFAELLDKEPKEFVEFLLKTYEGIIKHNHINIWNPRSIADKSKVKRLQNLQKYLGVK